VPGKELATIADKATHAAITAASAGLLIFYPFPGTWPDQPLRAFRTRGGSSREQNRK
jgi:hypothetical protein